MNAPAFQFYPGDWLKDPCLAQCSLATKGAWIDLLAHMHEAKTPGKLEGTYQCFARMCRCSVEEIEAAILELKATKTTTVTISKGASSQGSNAKVTVINRRMLKDFKAKQNAAHRQAQFRAKRKSNAQSNGAGNGKIPYSSSSTSTSTSKIDPPYSPPLRNGKAKKLPSLDDLHAIYPWLNIKAWGEFRQHRKDLKPLTVLAEVKAIATLDKLRAKEEQQSIIDRSIINGWKGLFPEKAGGSNGHGPKNGREWDAGKQMIEDVRRHYE